MNKHNKRPLNKWQKVAILAVAIFFVIPSLSPAQITSERIDVVGNIKQFKVQHTMDFSTEDLMFDKLMGYDIVGFKDGDYLNEIGKPMLPSITLKIALPTGMAATDVHVVKTEQEEINGKYTIFPSQPLRTSPNTCINSEFI